MLIKKYRYCVLICLCASLQVPMASAASVTHSTTVSVFLTIPAKIEASVSPGSDQKDNTLCVTSQNVKQYRLHAVGQGNMIKRENDTAYRIEPDAERDTGLVAANYTEKRTAPEDCSSEVISPDSASLDIPHIINNTERTTGVVISAE